MKGKKDLGASSTVVWTVRREGESNIGIISLTPENLNERWLLFEAGALSKKKDNARAVLPGLELSVHNRLHRQRVK